MVGSGTNWAWKLTPKFIVRQFTLSLVSTGTEIPNTDCAQYDGLLWKHLNLLIVELYL